MPRNLLVNGEILLYGDVGDPFGFGDGFTANDVADALAEHGDADVTARINSGGGIAHEGMAIHSLLKAHSGKVTVAIDGLAASAASLIAMAGADIQMRDGAMLMIHDPSGITFGNEERHIAAAGKLGKIADNYAGVYAKRAGKDKPAVRQMMKAETWLTADEAIEQGFASSKLAEPSLEKAHFDYRVYAKAPRDLPVRVRSADQPAALAASPKDPTMKKEWAAAFYAAADSSGLTLKELNAIVAKHETIEAAKADLDAQVKVKKDAELEAARLRDASQATAKAWAAGFFASAASSGLELKALNEIVAKAGSLEAAKDALIDAMATAHNADKPGANGGHVTVGTEDREKFVTGVTKSIVAKAALFNEGGKPAKDGERNEFSAFTLRELARMSLEKQGQRLTAIHDPMRIIQMAMAPVIMSGAMSTSDFVNILANVANKAMLKGYEEAAETFQVWTGKGTLTDFKVAKRVDVGLFPSLAKVQEGAEYTYAKLTDRGVDIVLATYGKLFPITRQAVINDDLSAFTKIPARMGQAARRTIGDLVYALLIANANMADGVALFHATHKNLQTGSALAASSLNSGRALMRKMPDPDNIKQGLNIKPAYLLVPAALEGTANQLMTSQSEPGQENPAVSNRVANMAQVVAEARLDVDSATSWYLAGNAGQYDTIEVDYLNGVEAPVLEQKDGWNVDGVEFKVRMDAGVNLLDFRALQKSLA